MSEHLIDCSGCYKRTLVTLEISATSVSTGWASGSGNFTTKYVLVCESCHSEYDSFYPWEFYDMILDWAVDHSYIAPIVKPEV